MKLTGNLKTQTENPITAIILAGGKSSRMGQDKGFLMFQNKTFIKHTIDAVTPITETIIIASNKKEYDIFGYQRVNDVIEDAGPLSGIVSGLKASQTRYNLVVTCDVPLLSTEVLMLLIKNISAEDKIIQLKTKTHQMPLLALYPASCLPVLEKSLLSGNRKVKIALQNCKVQSVVVDSCFEKNIENINTQKQFKQLNENSR